MKRYFIYVVFILLTFTSCRKDLSSDVVRQQSTSDMAQLEMERTDNSDQIVRVDITGQKFTNPCTGGTLTVLQGIIQFNIAPDNVTIRSTVNSRLVMQDASGIIYHGVFVETFEQHGSISQGTLHDTLRFILNPQGGGTNLNLHSMFHVTVNANGVFTADMTQFTLNCQ